MTVKKLWEPVADEPQDCDHCYNASTKYGNNRLSQCSYDRNSSALGWGVWIPDEPYQCSDSDSCEMPAITRIYYHSGGLSGVTTMLFVVPEQDLVITALANTNPFPKILDLVLFLTKLFAI